MTREVCTHSRVEYTAWILPYQRHIRRSQALHLLGFPEQVDKYLITHREYVLENDWTFKRIRMKRHSQEDELVTSVSAWKFYPQEQ